MLGALEHIVVAIAPADPSLEAVTAPVSGVAAPGADDPPDPAVGVRIQERQNRSPGVALGRRVEQVDGTVLAARQVGYFPSLVLRREISFRAL